MITPLPTSVRFDNAPVVELIIGVQFPPLAFTTGHLGWFWKSKLGDAWPNATDAPPLQDQFERFGDEMWGVPALQISLLRPGITRLQISGAEDDRVVQIQNTRFIYNWRKRQNAYPSFQKTCGEFSGLYGKFSDFVRDAGLGSIAPNQWEVTYIDHIPKGSLWQTAGDWHKVLPGLFPIARRIPGLHFEDGGEWRYEIEPQTGRLHISVQRGRISATEPEVLVVQWTARGPVPAQMGGLTEGLNMAHEVILRAFLELTSPEAQKAWGRRQ